jgi:AraC-like DNA-binding protein
MRAELETPTPVFFKHRRAAGPLSKFVELFWYWSGHPRTFEYERILPMPAVELVIKLEGAGAWAGLSGPRSESFIIERRDSDCLLGVHFKSGGAFPFLRCAYGELHNSNATLAELWGEKKARRLVELLYEAGSVEQKFDILERWLMWIADRPLDHHPAVVFALQTFGQDPGLFTSEEVAKHVNMSQRRFIELFRDEVGMTPKLFCRVQRFQNVIHAIEHKSEAEVDWIDIALSHGYSDQSHFIHDFRGFSGLRPTEYLPLRTNSLSHVRIPD